MAFIVKASELSDPIDPKNPNNTRNMRLNKYIHNLQENTYTYSLLLQKSKENFKDYQKASDLKVFIKIWMC